MFTSKGQYQCYTDAAERKRTVKYYNKADYILINQALMDVDWNQEIGGEQNIESVWNKFKRVVMAVEDQYIPIKKFDSFSTRKPRIILDSETFELVRKKNRLSRRYTVTKDPNDRRACNKVRKTLKGNLPRKLWPTPKPSRAISTQN